MHIYDWHYLKIKFHPFYRYHIYSILNDSICVVPPTQFHLKGAATPHERDVCCWTCSEVKGGHPNWKGTLRRDLLPFMSSFLEEVRRKSKCQHPYYHCKLGLANPFFAIHISTSWNAPQTLPLWSQQIWAKCQMKRNFLFVK